MLSMYHLYVGNKLLVKKVSQIPTSAWNLTCMNMCAIIDISIFDVQEYLMNALHYRAAKFLKTSFKN